MTIEWSLGLCASRGSRTIDVGAGAGRGVLVVADGMGGHSTGWLGARLAVHAIVERGVDIGQYNGAADGFPDEWGWAGAMQSSAAAEDVYRACAADFGERDALPRDLDGLFHAIDDVVRKISTHTNIHSLMVGCVAAQIEGAHVRGAHAGIGRALVLRDGASAVESLVVEHYLHLVHARIALPEFAGVDIASIPQQIIMNGLGGLSVAKIGIDPFELELARGDLLVLCSHRLDVSDDELVRLARDNVGLDRLARSIEQRAANVFPEAHEAQDVAFALARLA